MAWDMKVGDERLVVLELPRVDPSTLQGLTETERAIVMRVVDGESNEHIAAERGVSPRTVANQLATVFRKLGVSGRAELVAAIVPRA